MGTVTKRTVELRKHKEQPPEPREPPNQKSSRTKFKLSTMKLLLFALIPLALSASLARETTSSPSEQTTTTEQENCKNHICKEDGLFPEGSCEGSFCQCSHGAGILKHCIEGTFFPPEYLVC